MKKIILIAAMVLGFAVAATAQPRALGARIGNGAEISYQHDMDGNFLEIDGGLGLGLGDGTMNIGATGIYNFMISQFGDGFGFYAGPGASLGGILGTMHAAVVGQVGLEYFFEGLPLQLSLDVRPSVGFNFAGGPLYWSAAAGLGVRYAF